MDGIRGLGSVEAGAGTGGRPAVLRAPLFGRQFTLSELDSHVNRQFTWCILKF